MTAAVAGSRPSVATLLRRARPWMVWGITRALGVAGVYGFVFYSWKGVFGTSSDVLLYGSWAWLFQHGHLPYSSYSVLYPPGVLPFMTIPAIRGPIYQAEFLALAAAVDAFVFHRLRRSGLGTGSALWLWGAVLVGPVFWARLDVFLAAAVVLAVLEVDRNRPERAAFWLGCAASLKVWPILLLLPVLLTVTGRRRTRTVAWGLAAPVALTLPVVAWGGLPGLLDSVRVQTGRGVEIESVFALPVELARTFNVWIVSPVETVSWEFDGHVGSVLGVIATVVMAAGLAGWLAAVLRRRGALSASMGPLVLLLAAILVATVKALSPQYALWVLAGAVVVADRTRARRRLVVCTLVFLASTQALFPFAFSGLIMGEWPSAMVAVVHAGAVLGVLLAAGACLPAVPAARTALVSPEEPNPGSEPASTDRPRSRPAVAVAS